MHRVDKLQGPEFRANLPLQWKLGHLDIKHYQVAINSREYRLRCSKLQTIDDCINWTVLKTWCQISNSLKIIPVRNALLTQRDTRSMSLGQIDRTRNGPTTDFRCVWWKNSWKLRLIAKLFLCVRKLENRGRWI